MLVWHKRVWACPKPRCSQRSWTETPPAVRPRAALTERVRQWAFAEVGRKGRSTAEVAREVGVGWATGWRTVAAKGRLVVDDPARRDGVEGLGVDQTAFLSATSTSPTTQVTGIVDVTCGRAPRLLDVVPGRSGRVQADWLAEPEPAWRAQITFAALDPFRGQATALRTELPDAVCVLDAFHVVHLGFAGVDQVCRRVQQETLSRRGHRDDPLYRIQRVRRRRADRLSVHARRRLQTGLARGDPDGEAAVTWWLAQHLCALYRRDSPDAARRDLNRLLAQMKLPGPRSRPARPPPRQLAGRAARLLAYRRREQRPRPRR